VDVKPQFELLAERKTRVSYDPSIEEAYPGAYDLYNAPPTAVGPARLGGGYGPWQQEGPDAPSPYISEEAYPGAYDSYGGVPLRDIEEQAWPGAYNVPSYGEDIWTGQMEHVEREAYPDNFGVSDVNVPEGEGGGGSSAPTFEETAQGLDFATNILNTGLNTAAGIHALSSGGGGGGGGAPASSGGGRTSAPKARRPRGGLPKGGNRGVTKGGGKRGGSKFLAPSQPTAPAARAQMNMSPFVMAVLGAGLVAAGVALVRGR